MSTSTPSRSGVSPSSSPRLPSPPPFTEVQFGPKSPSVGGSISELQLEAAGKQDDGAMRRIRPGTRAIEMARGPPFVPLHQVRCELMTQIDNTLTWGELESPFQLQEYLQSLYQKLTRDESSDVVRPVTKEMALELATPPTAADTGETVERNLWLYELCRFLCSRTTRMIVAFFADNPPCSSLTCPEMRASEWQYLCAVHEPPKSCCAIDYCNHTLDWASNVLTSTKHFPSRLSLGGEGGNAHQSMRQLTNIFRRVYRIYAHAWFQHREVFWAIEAELGLYQFFKTVCDVYQLIPEDNYTIPPEAEGEREENLQTPVNTQSPQRVAVLQKPIDQSSAESPQSPANTTLTTGATTRRHKHTPSTGVPVAVIAEGAEEDEETSRANSAGERKPRSPTKKPDLQRLNSPKHIDLPQDNEAERAPEDPTPVAVHGTNPFVVSSEGDLSTQKKDSDTPPAAESEEISTSPIAETDAGANSAQSKLNAEESHKSADNVKAQTAPEDGKVLAVVSKTSEDGDEEGNETMERIEVPPSIALTAALASTGDDADPASQTKENNAVEASKSETAVVKATDEAEEVQSPEDVTA